MVSAFGEPGVVDTVGIVGYYTMLAMMLNTSRTPAPENGGRTVAAPIRMQATPHGTSTTTSFDGAPSPVPFTDRTRT